MNGILKILSSLLIGFICGPLSVYLGIGTFTMTTILSLSGLVKDFSTAVGTTLLTVTTPALIFPLYSYYKTNRIDFEVGIPLFIGYFIGTYIASTYFMDSVSIKDLYLMFGIFLMVVSVVFIKKSKYIF
jgi:uncharacterized membrane protein YfcA